MLMTRGPGRAGHKESCARRGRTAHLELAALAGSSSSVFDNAVGQVSPQALGRCR